MTIFQAMILVSLKLMKIVYSQCVYCSVFDDLYIHDLTSQKYCLLNSLCSSNCKNTIINNEGNCYRNDVKITKKICSSYLIPNSTGTITTGLIPAGHMCYWKFSMERYSKLYSTFSLQSTNNFHIKVYFFIKSLNGRSAQQYDISSSTSLILNISGIPVEIIALSTTTNEPSQIEIEWNEDSSSSNSSKVTNIILGVSGGVFFVFLVVVLCCLLQNIRKKNSQVDPSAEYQSVPVECSFNMQLEQMCPVRVFDSKSPVDPCCICFDKYNVFRITFGCLIRVMLCQHVFHSACIDEWANEKSHNSVCPLCLKPLV